MHFKELAKHEQGKPKTIRKKRTEQKYMMTKAKEYKRSMIQRSDPSKR
jgi:hypothetical protein